MAPPGGARPGGRPASVHHETATARARDDRRLKLLLAATALCYAIGYPLALIGHSDVGWLFVFFGGPLLIAVILLVIRRIQR